MLQQQVYIINTILMILDAVCVIASGSGAYYIKYYESSGIYMIDNISLKNYHQYPVIRNDRKQES